MKIVVASDAHFPHGDDKVILLFERFLKDYKPDVLVFNGDLLDCETISKFDSVPGGSLKEELFMCKEFLSDIRRILPNTEIHYILGNHEMRLRSYLIRNIKDPTTFNVIKERLSLADLLDLDKLKIDFHDLPENISRFDDNYIYKEGFYIGHWNRVSKNSAYTVKLLVEDKGVSVIQGHTHRLGLYFKKTLNKTLIGAESGCLCKTEPDYCVNPNWQSGFCIIENGTPHLIYINNYKFSYGEKIYSLDSEEHPFIIP
jgi:predicted phosphodiesterase